MRGIRSILNGIFPFENVPTNLQTFVWLGGSSPPGQECICCKFECIVCGSFAPFPLKLDAITQFCMLSLFMISVLYSGEFLNDEISRPPKRWIKWICHVLTRAHHGCCHSNFFNSSPSPLTMLYICWEQLLGRVSSAPCRHEIYLVHIICKGTNCNFKIQPSMHGSSALSESRIHIIYSHYQWSVFLTTHECNKWLYV